MAMAWLAQRSLISRKEKASISVHKIRSVHRIRREQKKLLV